MNALTRFKCRSDRHLSLVFCFTKVDLSAIPHRSGHGFLSFQKPLRARATYGTREYPKILLLYKYNANIHLSFCTAMSKIYRKERIYLCGSVVVKALCYKLEGRGFDTR
jgi:hypothetical protein